MQSPEGERMANVGSFLEVVPNGSGTKYTAVVMHPTEEGRKQHEAMGLHDGWDTALDQLVALVKAR